MVSKKLGLAMIALLLVGAAAGAWTGYREGFDAGQAILDKDGCGQHPATATSFTEVIEEPLQFNNYKYESDGYFTSPDTRVFVLADVDSDVNFSTLRLGEIYNLLLDANTAGKFCTDGKLFFHFGGNVTYIWK